ncbi:ATP synthase subunit I [Thalassobacillus sp. C254]|uniref:ATP synthase subunit I n=1 Tax=Thalassobacillus sp. C254 TaxID=1225341 RepID=UPI0006D00696|nr:ATP synthase subunit I [Thalassobacillus sp. C254]
MKDFSLMIKQYTQYTLYLTALYVLGWGFTPYETLFLSLSLGALFSLYMLWSMYRKITKLNEAIDKGKKFFTIGTVSRLALAGLLALLAIRYPDTFNIVGLVVGLMTPYILILVHALLQIRRLSKQ